VDLNIVVREGGKMGTTHWPKDPLDGRDISLLSAVLRGWCVKHNLELSAHESQEKARELVNWFEFGVKDPAELSDLIDDRHWQVAKI
jgi:hypothetical protein